MMTVTVPVDFYCCSVPTHPARICDGESGERHHRLADLGTTHIKLWCSYGLSLCCVPLELWKKYDPGILLICFILLYMIGLIV